ncbi:MAG: hypothetical protein PHP45_05065 [Elusimicrobiales bacterium]|nr:hypothetical protein [Elusimicrobiales bacterium]
MTTIHYAAASCLIFIAAIAAAALRGNPFSLLCGAGLVFGAAAVNFAASGGGARDDGGNCFLVVLAAALLCGALACGCAAALALRKGDCGQVRKNKAGDGGEL